MKDKRIDKHQRTVMLIDNHGLSFYTSYLACGVAKFNKVLLLGISEEEYKVTGASKEKKIEFHNIGAKLPKTNSILSIIFVRQLRWFCILFDSFLKTKYDIVHVQGHLPTFFLFIPLLKLRHKRICWTLHDVNLRPSSKGLRGRLELLYVKMVTQPAFLLTYADKIIVHGLFLKNQLLSRGIRSSKIVVIPIFDYRYLLKYEQEYQDADRIIKWSTHVREEYVLVFGRIKPYKGIDVLINALRIVRKQLTDPNRLQVLIAGKGDTSYFQHMLTKEDSKFIHIRNEIIPNHEIPQLFKMARFVILPYTDASQSAITSLAYTFSKPVVASNVGSIGEYVDNDQTGLIFEPGNTFQLADSIRYLIENPAKCAEMGMKAHQKVLDEMSLEKCSSIVNQSYN